MTQDELEELVSKTILGDHRSRKALEDIRKAIENYEKICLKIKDEVVKNLK